MPVFTAALGSSVSGISVLSHLFNSDIASPSHHHSPPSSPSRASALANPIPIFLNSCRNSPVRRHYPLHAPKVSVSSYGSAFPNSCRNSPVRRRPLHTPKVSVSGDAKYQELVAATRVIEDSSPSPEDDKSKVIEEVATTEVIEDSSASPKYTRDVQMSADWKEARNFVESGFIYKGRITNFNHGGLRVRFRSLLGFLPFRELSPSHSCEEPNKTIEEIALALKDSLISVKVIEADQEKRKLIFSEKEAKWSKFSEHINVGEIFEGRVGSVEDYGAFVHLRFPDGSYHLTGFVHVSEVSWDLVQDVRDILRKGDEVRVKMIKIDREKSRITLSIKRLGTDPLLETLDKVIPKDDSVVLGSLDSINLYEPLPGLEGIIEELLQEEGISDIRITRQGIEKRVVSQDLQLWLSNQPQVGKQFTLLARAGRKVQEIQLTTSLNQEGIKMALQRVLERVP